jgi:hypothetical protein
MEEKKKKNIERATNEWMEEKGKIERATDAWMEEKN